MRRRSESDSLTLTMEMHGLAVFLMMLCAAATSGVSSAARVDTFTLPAFDNTTTQDLVAASSTAILLPAALLFEHDVAFSDFNRTEGFLEASFNTSITLTGAAAFVVVNDRFPTLHGRGGLRGFANYSSPDDGASNAKGSLASVEAGPLMRSYGPDNPAVGLNVTVVVPPSGGARSVWIEYDAAAHRLSVRVDGAGEPTPSKALLAGRRTTETAFVGFLAAVIQDIVVGVVVAWTVSRVAVPAGII